MPRYIDADKLIEFIDKRGTGLGITVANCCNFREIVNLIPTEDVVPRSEVEKAKQEVSSNMLEDFLKLIALTYDKWVFKSELEDTEKEIVMDLFQDLDTTELRKKYIGE